jgi:hypothetical protein
VCYEARYAPGLASKQIVKIPNFINTLAYYYWVKITAQRGSIEDTLDVVWARVIGKSVIGS